MKTVVYTCITGGYDCLKEVPRQFMDKDLDFVCYTDDPNLKSETWTMRMIPEELSRLTKVKQQRIIKICPNKFFPEYETSLWIDGSMEIVGSIIDLLRQCELKKYPLWTMKHPSRSCIYEEEKAVLGMKKDIPSITAPQMKKYLKEGYPRNYGLIESGVMYRKHNDELCRKTMFLWANELLKGSHRDQLSFNYCCWKTGLKYGTISRDLIKKTLKWTSLHPKINRKSLSNNILSEEKSIQKVNSVNIYTVNFNRSELTNAWIKSVLKNVSGFDYKIFVVDNSDKTPFVLDKFIDKSLVTIIDNTNDKIIPLNFAVKYFSKFEIAINKNGSFKHALTIQWILDNCNCDNLLLFDSDVILKRNIDFIDPKYATVAWIRLREKMKPRFAPFIQYFNVKYLNEHKIRYFDADKMNGGMTAEGYWYDTGASMYEIFEEKKIPWKSIDIDKYVNHLADGSRRGNSMVQNFLRKNLPYYDLNTVKNYPLMTSKNDFDVIVSLTTYETRLKTNTLPTVLNSVLNQKTHLKIKITLTLYKDDLKFIDQNLKKFLEDNNVEMLIAEKNLRPHLKYFEVMKKYKNIPIITIDDDIIYEDSLVDELYDSYLKYPTCVSAKRVHEITYDKNGCALKYDDWKKECKTVINPSLNLVATGVGGVIYPPDILKISDNDISKIQTILTNDDLFLRWKEMTLGVNVKYVPSRKTYKFLPIAIDKSALILNDNTLNNNKYVMLLNFKRINF